MAVSVKVGDAEVVALADGQHPFDLAWHYPSLGEGDWAPYLADSPELLNFGAYLIRTGGQTVLVDTGWGPRFAPPGGLTGPPQLLEELASVGVTPDDVDVVALTHLHPDHIGWNLVVEDGAEPRARFPRARYLVPTGDVDHYRRRVDAGEPIHPSIVEQGLGLEGLEQTEPLEDGQEIVPGLRAIAAPGHTPGHTCIELESGGERFVVLADIVHHAAVLEETAWVQFFDWDPEQARASRERLLDDVERRGSLVGLGHLPYPSLGRVARDATGRRVWIQEDVDA